MKLQSPSRQSAHVEAEVNELVESHPEGVQADEHATLGTNYILASELAIRAIEAELDQSIQRQVALTADRGCDGYFKLGDDAQIVEVKYFAHRIDYQRIRNTLAKARQLFVHPGLESARTICVIVAEDVAIGGLSKSKLKSIKAELEVDVIFRIYSFRALQEKFGA